MLIKTLQGLCDSSDIVVCNKVRISKIRENMINDDKNIKIFNQLTEELNNKNKNIVKKIIIENTFYEEIPDVAINKFINAYENSSNREELINKFKESYVIRGDKGFFFSWMPIILKGE